MLLSYIFHDTFNEQGWQNFVKHPAHGKGDRRIQKLWPEPFMLYCWEQTRSYKQVSAVGRLQNKVLRVTSAVSNFTP